MSEGTITEFTRVKLIRDFKSGSQLFKKGLIGTVRGFLDSDIVMVQYSYDQHAKFVGFPSVIIQKVSQEDLDSIQDTKDLLPAHYHINNVFSIENGYDENGDSIYESAKIVDINLSINESNDKFTLEFSNGKTEKLTKKYLDTFGSWLPYDLGNVSEFKSDESYYHIIPRSIEDRNKPYRFYDANDKKEEV